MNCQRRGIRLKFCKSDCNDFENEQLQKIEQIKKVRQQEELEQKKVNGKVEHMVARKTIEGRTTVDGRADERKVFVAGTVE